MSEQRKKLQGSAGRRHKGGSKNNSPDPSVLLNLGNDAYDGDNGESRRRREAEQNAIVPTSDGSLEYRGIRLTPVGLEIPKSADNHEVLEAFGQLLFQMDSAISFWLGDWTNSYLHFVAQSMGFQSTILTPQQRKACYQKIAIDFGMNEKTLRNIASVCRKVILSQRWDGLSFNHHAKVSPLDMSEQRHWLSLADRHDWSIAEFGQRIKSNNDDPEEKLIQHSDDTPPWLKPVYQFSEKVVGAERGKWEKLTKRQRHRIYQELSGIVDWMSEEFED